MKWKLTYILRRREFPIILLAVVEIAILLDYYVVQPQVQGFATELRTYTVVLAAFATIVATTDLTRQHVHTITRRMLGRWVYSLVLMISLVVTIAVGLIFGQTSSQVNYIQSNVLTPGSWGLSGMILFYIFTSGWRAFRVRSVDSSLLFIGCVLTCIGMAPLTTYYWPVTATIKTWLSNYIQTSVARAFEMTSAIGGIIFGIRVLFGYERRYVA